ncbi:MAG: ankyrin repeat domain-containing protein [Verrucomicrobiae bacterium]
MISTAALAFGGSGLFSDPAGDGAPEVRDALGLLAAGDQLAAEARLAGEARKNPENGDAGFLAAVLTRSRFDRTGSAPVFLKTLARNPDSLEGKVSACILGIDISKDEGTALYFYNALLVLSRQNPRSIPTRWMAAVMARTLTRGKTFKLSGEVRKRILQCGIREYEAVLDLMAPGPGPVLVHQTMANLLDDAQGYDAAWKHREIAIKMERAPWSLHAAADTLLKLERAADALPLVQEAISMRPDAPNYYDLQGKCLWSLGRKRDAISAWDRAASLAPETSCYLNTCAWGFRSFGDYASAREYTRKSLSKNPNDRIIRILDARLAVLLREPGAGERLLEAGQVDFQGKPIGLDKPADPWFFAVTTGDLEKLRQMMGTADINAQSSGCRQTALMHAAQAGWEHIAAELIRAGAKLDLVDENGNTALHYSAQFGQPRVMKLLLDAGAKTDIQDKWKQTPLIMCSGGWWEGFLLLMEKKASTAPFTPHGGTALHYAAGHGELAMVKALLASGADVQSPAQRNGDTPLIAACRDWAHSYLVVPLLSAGADVNARDKDGRSALHHAVEPLLNLPLVEMLLEKGADPTLADKKGTTPIAQARLLGFEDLASQMEKKSSRSEAFRFPQFEPPDADLTADERNASLFVLPILLAQGHPLGRPSGVSAGDKGAARKELRWMFGIESAADLQDEIQALAGFRPQYRDEPGVPSAGGSSERFFSLLNASAEKIFSSSKNGAKDDAAWIQSHIIYLADLGASAGFLKPEEGEKLIGTASSALKGQFSSWAEYLASFLYGAQIHNGWEAGRYGRIGDRLLESGLIWH